MSNLRYFVVFGSASLALALAATAHAQDAEPAAAKPAAEESVELPVRLLERDPFDRVTLDAANGNAVIETVLLDLPERRVPSPFPDSGSLTLYRLSSPSIPYKVSWSAIAKIELYEQMLLAEANRLTNAGEFGEAFEYLAYLTLNYPQLDGLEAVRQEHLWREASAEYAAGNRDAAWPILLALYQRNPQFPRLVNAVQAVSDNLISQRLQEKDYAAAGALLKVLQQSFSKLQLPNIERWRQKFQQDAQAQLAKAREALEAKRYAAARDAVNYAMAILPGVEGGAELWRTIQTSAPEIRVGVTQGGAVGDPAKTADWSTARVRDLVDPRLVKMVDFGGEGGIYASPWGELLTSDSGMETTVRFSAKALARGLTPSALALRLVEMAGSEESMRREDLVGLLKSVALVGGRDVVISWRRPHIRPESLLQIPLRWIASGAGSDGLWYELQALGEEARPNEQHYQRTGSENNAGGAPASIVEVIYPDDDAALAALVRGDVDVLDRVPPWQLQRVRSADNVTVDSYRLPTVHVLIPNLDNPLLEIREFRRALCYAIDGESIVQDILLAGGSEPGYRTLSGPFPAGTGLNDPVGYAYNGELAPRPYEPRLAALLAGVARSSLAKREAALKKEQAAAKQDAAAEKPKEAAAEPSSDKPPKLPPMEPLRLAHPADPLARLACGSIKIQLDQIGIPVTLVETPSDPAADPVPYDLLYVELAVYEPVYEARRLLGPDGVAGRSSALISRALDELDRAQNWNQARAQLKEIHRIAYYDLPLIPLWQTVSHFAYRSSLDGVGERPVKLYQNVSEWRKSAE